MNLREESPPPEADRGTCVALMFALVAERLATFFEHDEWLTIAQGAALAAEWLTRSKRRMPVQLRKHLSALSDQLARKIAETLSREAGLHTVYEMMESLDPNYQSNIGQSLMVECERLLDSESLT